MTQLIRQPIQPLWNISVCCLELLCNCEDNLYLIYFILTINSHPDRSCSVANSVSRCAPILSILFPAYVFQLKNRTWICLVFVSWSWPHDIWRRFASCVTGKCNVITLIQCLISWDFSDVWTDYKILIRSKSIYLLQLIFSLNWFYNFTGWFFLTRWFFHSSVGWRGEVLNKNNMLSTSPNPIPIPDPIEPPNPNRNLILRRNLPQFFIVIFHSTGLELQTTEFEIHHHLHYATQAIVANFFLFVGLISYWSQTHPLWQS